MSSTALNIWWNIHGAGISFPSCICRANVVLNINAKSYSCSGPVHQGKHLHTEHKWGGQFPKSHGERAFMASNQATVLLSHCGHWVLIKIRENQWMEGISNNISILMGYLNMKGPATVNPFWISMNCMRWPKVSHCADCIGQWGWGGGCGIMI